MSKNTWVQHAEALSEAFLRHDGNVQSAMIERALQEYADLSFSTVLDVGGGNACLALALARRGCEVTIIDIDQRMIEYGQRIVADLDDNIQRNIKFIHGDGRYADHLFNNSFDICVCHSVLMYEHQLDELIHPLVAAANDGGIVSVSSVNPESWAMRSGLQGRYQEAVEHLLHGKFGSERFVDCTRHSRKSVADSLRRAGAHTLGHYGLGIFIDHLEVNVTVNDPEMLFEAEWLAGSRAPYRDIARCFHIIARKAAT